MCREGCWEGIRTLSITYESQSIRSMNRSKQFRCSMAGNSRYRRACPFFHFFPSDFLSFWLVVTQDRDLTRREEDGGRERRRYRVEGEVNNKETPGERREEEKRSALPRTKGGGDLGRTTTNWRGKKEKTKNQKKGPAPAWTGGVVYWYYTVFEVQYLPPSTWPEAPPGFETVFGNYRHVYFYHYLQYQLTPA